MSLDTVKKIVKALDDKKANDIEVIKINELTIVADYFVIATANSNTHIRSLADEVEYQLEEAGIKLDHAEGRATGWVLLEFQGVVVHIFLEDARNYYNLERLWEDGAKLDISEFID
ncbi:MAG: ribosome silencing factor [Clostridia bacterium]|nr:ribosome silencing factor [Clostridia bacterium]MBQ6837313.1 ribosome silencing factor [Clostridia bacterium]